MMMKNYVEQPIELLCSHAIEEKPSLRDGFADANYMCVREKEQEGVKRNSGLQILRNSLIYLIAGRLT